MGEREMKLFGLALLLGLAACAPQGASDAAQQEATVAPPATVAPTATVAPEAAVPPVATAAGATQPGVNETVHGEPVEPQPQPASPEPVDLTTPVHGEPVEPQPQLPDAQLPKTPSEPQSAQRAPEDLLTQDGVHYGCKTDADCEVKNVGNCCGYFPACVNKESPTFPEKVKADCATSGMSSICGFQEISSCQCLEGRCAGVAGPAGGALQ
jgi:hypothetical protein